jgi:hypothetical protein
VALAAALALALGFLPFALLVFCVGGAIAIVCESSEVHLIVVDMISKLVVKLWMWIVKDLEFAKIFLLQGW